MNSSKAASAVHSVIPVKRLELSYAPRPWRFAEERRAEIEANFARRRRELPDIWNGQMLLLHHHRVDGDCLEGAFLQTDYASFMLWKDSGFPEAGVMNCFSMGALQASDGGWLVGVMGPHTAAAGRIYFPAGTPEPSDIIDGSVDLAGSMTREVAEETGLGPEDYAADDDWCCVVGGPRIALMKMLRAHEPAEAVRRRIRAHLARERAPELADMRIVRRPSDLDPMMPLFMIAFFNHLWS